VVPHCIHRSPFGMSISSPFGRWWVSESNHIMELLVTLQQAHFLDSTMKPPPRSTWDSPGGSCSAPSLSFSEPELNSCLWKLAVKRIRDYS
jgi:hypothetical protein